MGNIHPPTPQLQNMLLQLSPVLSLCIIILRLNLSLSPSHPLSPNHLCDLWQSPVQRWPFPLRAVAPSLSPVETVSAAKIEEGIILPLNTAPPRKKMSGWAACHRELHCFSHWLTVFPPFSPSLTSGFMEETWFFKHHALLPALFGSPV